MIKLLLLFALGSVSGWIIEVIRRSYLNKKFINPGYFKGPYLPIYGFGTIILYFLSSIEINIIAKTALFLFSTTLLEFITGIIFILYFKIELWNYSKNKFNYKGIICIKNSIYWTILSLLFYFIIYPIIKEILEKLTFHTEIIYLTGIFYGFVLFDLFGIIRKSYEIKSFVKNFNEKYNKNINITYSIFRKYSPRINEIVKEKLTKELLSLIKKGKKFLMKNKDSKKKNSITK
jgi:uncharacterized membrane protein